MNIVYTKIPKTASTLYCRLIEVNYSKKNNLKIYIPGREGWRDPKIPIFPVIKDGVDDRNNHINGEHNISARHLSQYRPFFEKIMEKPLKYVTTLRHPLERMASHFYCNVIGQEHRYGGVRDFNIWYSKNYSNLNLTDYQQMNDMLHLGFNNLMSFMLDFHNEEEITFESVKNKLDLILLTEKTEESIKILSNFLGIEDISQGSYKTTMERKNNNPTYKQFKINDNVLHLFKENNNMDYKLYEIGLQLFEEQMNEL
jgi:hypothetical protein